MAPLEQQILSIHDDASLSDDQVIHKIEELLEENSQIVIDNTKLLSVYGAIHMWHYRLEHNPLYEGTCEPLDKIHQILTSTP